VAGIVAGILSDTHLASTDPRLAGLLEGPLGGAQVIIHAGDHAAPAVVEYLEYDEPRPYYGVAGNMDGARTHAALGASRVFTLGGLTVGLVHGWGAPEGLEERVLTVFDALPDVVVFGHSHKPLVNRRGKTLLVNPGSPFQPRGVAKGSVALLTVEDGVASARIVYL